MLGVVLDCIDSLSLPSYFQTFPNQHLLSYCDLYQHEISPKYETCAKTCLIFVWAESNMDPKPLPAELQDLSIITLFQYLTSNIS